MNKTKLCSLNIDAYVLDDNKNRIEILNSEIEGLFKAVSNIDSINFTLQDLATDTKDKSIESMYLIEQRKFITELVKDKQKKLLELIKVSIVMQDLPPEINLSDGVKLINGMPIKPINRQEWNEFKWLNI